MATCLTYISHSLQWRWAQSARTQSAKGAVCRSAITGMNLIKGFKQYNIRSFGQCHVVAQCCESKMFGAV